MDKQTECVWRQSLCESVKMSKVQTLRAFVQQRLTAAAEQIFEQFERTMAEYEEELCRSKEENERQRKLLRAVLQPEVRLHRADVQQLLVSKEELPSEQQEFSSSLDQEDSPELPHIKEEEEEELWSSQEGEQLQGLQEADITKFTFTAVPVKSDEDEEKPQSSQLHQRQTEHMETEADGDDCGGPEPARNCNPERNLQPVTDDESSHSEPETDDSCDLEETKDPQSGSNPLHNNEEPAGDVKCNSAKTSVNSSECATSFDHKGHHQKNDKNQTREKSLSCSICENRVKSKMFKYVRVHTEEKPFSCSVCGKRFTRRSNLNRHLRLLHSKEEEELRSSREGEQLQGLKEADITKFTFTAVPVKSEEDEEKPQSSQPHQRQTEHMETEADGDDCGGPEPARNCNPERNLQPVTDDESSHSEPETDDSCEWEETKDPQSGSSPLLNNEEPAGDVEYNSVKTSVNSSECTTSFDHKGHHQKPHGIQTKEKSCSCSVCCKQFSHQSALSDHLKIHSGEKLFSGSVFKKQVKSKILKHMRDHTGEKPFSCSVCGKRFTRRSNLNRHMRLLHSVEKEELWSSQEGEQLQGPQEADITKFTFTAVPVKSEEDEEKPQSSQLHQRQTEHMETEADGDDCGGPEPARNFNPERNLQPVTDDESSHSEPETDDSCEWEETKDPQSGSNPLHNNEEPGGDVECNSAKTSVNSSEYTTSFDHKGHHQKNGKNQTGEKSLSCSVCGKRYHWKQSLKYHMTVHSEEKPFSCSVCKKSFSSKNYLASHLSVHSGEKPFKCSICGKRFLLSSHLSTHETVHSGEKPYSCSVCKKRFNVKSNMLKHMRNHTGERPFSCSVCGRRFSQRSDLNRHLMVHSGEKPFSCSVCGRMYARKSSLKTHMRLLAEGKLSAAQCVVQNLEKGCI